MSDQITNQQPKNVRWQRVVGFEGLYQISSSGSLWRLARTTSDGRRLPARLLKPIETGGYLYIVLCPDSGTHRRVPIHRLVCEAFHGPCLGREPNHIDGDKKNNAAENLEWVTRSENQLHAADIGLKPHGEASHLAKLTICEVRAIRALLKLGSAQRKIAEKFGISQTQVSRISTNKKWRNDR